MSLPTSMDKIFFFYLFWIRHDARMQMRNDACKHKDIATNKQIIQDKNANQIIIFQEIQVHRFDVAALGSQPFYKGVLEGLMGSFVASETFCLFGFWNNSFYP